MSLRNKFSGLLSLGLLLLGNAAFAGKPGEFGDSPASAEPSVWLSILYYTLLIVLVGMALAIIGRVLKAYELSSEATGNKKSVPWNTINAVLALLFLIVGMYYAIWEIIVHGKKILPDAASLHGETWDSMFSVTFILTFIVFVITQVLLFGFAFKYRHQKGRKAYFYPHNDKLEMYWTAIPAIVLTVLVVFGWVAWNNITNPDKQSKNPVLVEVVGEQFKWSARYPGNDGKLGPHDYKLIAGVNTLGVDFTDQSAHDDFMPLEIVLPVNKPVKFEIRAKDVIHSVYIPQFRVQMNAVPGIPTTFYFTPTVTTEDMRAKLGDAEFDYLLYCNKICGASHYNMSMTVRVVSEVEYQKWLDEQKPFYTDAIKQQMQTASATAGEAPTKVLAATIN